MIKLSRFLLLIATIMVSAIYLPKFYWMAFDVSPRVPRVMYSSLTREFMFIKTEFTNRIPQMKFLDSHGNSYTRDEFEKKLPLNYYRQLAATDQMPDSIGGVKIDLKEVRRNQVFIRIKPYGLNSPQIELFPLFESASGRVRIVLPEDYFRIQDRMEFINAYTNKIDREKSKLFTDSLRAAGFQFPALSIAGNPTTRKPFDEGYFVEDAQHQLFHIKMVKGKPFCRNTHVPTDLQIQGIKVLEHPLREFYGLIVTEKNKVFLLSYDNYKLIELPLPEYNRKNTILYFRGNLFYRVLILRKPNSLQAIVTDRQYRVMDRYRTSWKKRDERLAGVVANYIFPFTIKLSDISSNFINFYFHLSKATFIVCSIFFLLLTVVMYRVKKTGITRHWLDLLLVLVTGLYGFIAIFIFSRIDS